MRPGAQEAWSAASQPPHPCTHPTPPHPAPPTTFCCHSTRNGPPFYLQQNQTSEENDQESCCVMNRTCFAAHADDVTARVGLRHGDRGHMLACCRVEGQRGVASEYQEKAGSGTDGSRPPVSSMGRYFSRCLWLPWRDRAWIATLLLTA